MVGESGSSARAFARAVNWTLRSARSRRRVAASSSLMLSRAWQVAQVRQGISSTRSAAMSESAIAGLFNVVVAVLIGDDTEARILAAETEQHGAHVELAVVG